MRCTKCTTQYLVKLKSRVNWCNDCATATATATVITGVLCHRHFLFSHSCSTRSFTHLSLWPLRSLWWQYQRRWWGKQEPLPIDLKIWSSAPDQRQRSARGGTLSVKPVWWEDKRTRRREEKDTRWRGESRGGDDDDDSRLLCHFCFRSSPRTVQLVVSRGQVGEMNTFKLLPGEPCKVVWQLYSKMRHMK